MLKIKVRTLLKYPTLELLDKLCGDFILVFDDGEEVVTNEREVIYSSFIWDLFRTYPETPVKKRHHLASAKKRNSVPANAHLRLLQAAAFDTIETYREQVTNIRRFSSEVAERCYQITNDIYNALTQHCEEYITTLDGLDFVEIAEDPRLEHIIATAPSTEEGIDRIQQTVKDLLFLDPKYEKNSVAAAVRRSISREAQLLQMVGVRGFTTDINSEIFKHPVRGNYINGINTLYESLIESRSAAKALANSERPLQDSEYFSRRQQLIGMNLMNLLPGDCGSTNYLEWRVRDAQFEGDVRILPCDLETIHGLWYLDEESGKLRVIQESDTHLIGKLIKIRNVVAGCASTDPYGICETCFGTGAAAVTEGANVGHAVVVALTAPMGQLILSTKHVDGTSKLEPVILRGLEKVYLTVNDAGTQFLLSPSLRGRRLALHIRCTDLPGMPDVVNSNSVTDLSVMRVSKFGNVVLEVFNSNGSDLIPLETRASSRLCSLSHLALEHLKKKGYRIETNTVTGDNKYVIDLEGWEVSNPLFVLPMSHFNMSDHQGEVAKLLESTAKEILSRSEALSPDALLIEFHDLVNRRLNIHLGVLSAILLASMLVSATEGLYDMPKAFTKRGVGVMRHLLPARSLSAMMAYQDHHRVLRRPASFMMTDRPDHPFDLLLKPELLNNPKFRSQYRS